MPNAGSNPNGNFIGLKGENCTLLKIRGVKILEDDQGNDIIKMMRKEINSTGSSSELEVVVTNLLQRLDTVEKYLKTLGKGERGERGEKGEQGEQGEPGEKGEQGIQGAKGKDGAKTLSALTDVNLDGLEDGATLVYSAKQKKFVVGLPEEN